MEHQPYGICIGIGLAFIPFSFVFFLYRSKPLNHGKIQMIISSISKKLLISQWRFYFSIFQWIWCKNEMWIVRQAVIGFHWNNGFALELCREKSYLLRGFCVCNQRSLEIIQSIYLQLAQALRLPRFFWPFLEMSHLLALPLYAILVQCKFCMRIVYATTIWVPHHSPWKLALC